MKTSSEDWLEWRFTFDRALQLRDQGELEHADRLLRHILESRPEQDQIFAHVASQLGHVLEQQGRVSEAISFFERAVAAAPTFELASLALFHGALGEGRRSAAWAEAVRFLEIRESVGYREMFEGYERDQPPADAEGVARCRALLADHRDRQLATAEFARGDTVRVHSLAPAEYRPGRLATIVRIDADVCVRFTDGETLMVPHGLLSYGEV
jgi:tetratricopeptide (TPR) repeat protein